MLLLPRPALAQEVDNSFWLHEVTSPELVGGIDALHARLVYPGAERLAGIEGCVVVRMVVDPAGVPREVEVVRSVSTALDSAAVVAIHKSRFMPCLQNRRAVACRMTLPVTFRVPWPTREKP